MATRSTIAMEQPDGRVMQIYCHWDGYLDHNGRILHDHYRDRAKVLALMLLGDISSLRPEIGEAHDFDQPANDQWCVAYGRDRGERDTAARVFQDFEDYRENHQYEEFEYVFRQDDQWYVAQYQRGYEPLAQALAGLAVAEDQ
jgi:hypothetical protein